MVSLAAVLDAGGAPWSVPVAAQESTGSVHAAQALELGATLELRTDDALRAEDLEARGALFPLASLGSPGPPGASRRAASGISPDFIVFGYLQSEAQVFHQRWHALTHVGSRFVSFDATGTLTGTSAFTARSSYLKAGGAAEAAGVKMILVVNQFDDAPGGVLATVMTSPERRAALAAAIAALVSADDYAHGVNLDFEFSWGPAVRDGVTAFVHELRYALDDVDPDLELSIYTNAIFSASQWDFDAETGITPAIDYMLYSMYDWATGGTPHAISDLDNCLGATRMHAYLADGLPPEKLVLVVSAYSRRWNATLYNGAGSSPSSSGFTDALFDVTLNPAFGGPYAEMYVTGDEAGWYAWNDGTPRVRTWEALEGIEVKLAHALSLRDPAGAWSGRRIRGVGFWSLMWMAELGSHDPRTGAAVSRTRTYPHVYQACARVFAAPGERWRLLDGFEGFDFRWRDPNEAPDSTGDADGDSAAFLIASPAGPGAPASGANAMALLVDVEGAGANRLVLAHELLASPLAPAVPDTNALLGHFDASTELRASVHAASGLPGYSVRFLIVDAAGELEASPEVSLDGPGWRTLGWDLTDAATVHGFATGEPALSSGDGVLATSGGDDLGFFGFAVGGAGAAVDTLAFDELGYADVDPGGAAYRINELRYADPAQEFVEVHGPAGPLPAGLELRVYEGDGGSVRRAIPLAGSIADDGDGSGFFVVGDPGVPNVDDASAFAPAADDLPNASPTGFQLWDPVRAHAHDSLVTQAFGGLGDLVRRGTHGVTRRGWPWAGEAAPGRDTAGVPYSLGRLPDGADTRVNARDFSFQRATPGATNGGAAALPLSMDFESTPAALFQTYDAPAPLRPERGRTPAVAGRRPRVALRGRRRRGA